MNTLEIYSKLPKKNCGECGVATCLAFAMKLAQKKEDSKKCPYISEENKKTLTEQSTTPIKKINIGKYEIGDETVMFRHEKKFYNKPIIAIMIEDNDPELEQKIKKINKTSFERIGEKLEIEMIAIKASEKEKFKQATQKIISLTTKEIMLIGNPEQLKEAIMFCSDRKPLLCSANLSNIEEVAGIAKNLPIVATAQNLEETKKLTKALENKGAINIIIEIKNHNTKQALRDLFAVRNRAIKGEKELGYPTIIFTDKEKELEEAALFITKYAQIIVLQEINENTLMPLLTLRQSIYSDPQKPIQIQPGIYEINNPDKNSTAYLTTNFSLTYFTVTADIQNTGQPGHLLVIDTEGMSVLTALAAGKLEIEKIAKAIKESRLEEKTKNKKIIIPGMMAALSGELEEKTGWQIIVGPSDSSELSEFTK